MRGSIDRTVSSSAPESRDTDSFRHMLSHVPLVEVTAPRVSNTVPDCHDALSAKHEFELPQPRLVSLERDAQLWKTLEANGNAIPGIGDVDTRGASRGDELIRQQRLIMPLQMIGKGNHGA